MGGGQTSEHKKKGNAEVPGNRLGEVALQITMFTWTAEEAAMCVAGGRDGRQQTATDDNRGSASERRTNKTKQAKARTALSKRLLAPRRAELQVPGLFRLCFLYTAVVFLSDYAI